MGIVFTKTPQIYQQRFLCKSQNLSGSPALPLKVELIFTSIWTDNIMWKTSKLVSVSNHRNWNLCSPTWWVTRTEFSLFSLTPLSKSSAFCRQNRPFLSLTQNCSFLKKMCPGSNWSCRWKLGGRGTMWDWQRKIRIWWCSGTKEMQQEETEWRVGRKYFCKACITTLLKYVQEICDKSRLVVVVHSLSRVWLFVTPWTAARQDSLSFTISQSLPNSCPLSRWCHPTISSSVAPFYLKNHKFILIPPDPV